MMKFLARISPEEYQKKFRVHSNNSELTLLRLAMGIQKTQRSSGASRNPQQKGRFVLHELLGLPNDNPKRKSTADATSINF